MSWRSGLREMPAVLWLILLLGLLWAAWAWRWHQGERLPAPTVYVPAARAQLLPRPAPVTTATSRGTSWRDPPALAIE